jgi:hypothetical protein
MIQCPSGEKKVLVSTTTSPVTHVAEVAMNRASIQRNGSPFRLAGCLSPIVPAIIVPENKKTGSVNGLMTFGEEGMTVLYAHKGVAAIKMARPEDGPIDAVESREC